MNTTDELREFVRGADGYELWCPRHKAELLAIADRIDAAYDEAMSRDGQLLADVEKDRDYNYANWQDCKQKVLQGNITIGELNARIERLEDELARCIKLPKDADDEYILPGDVMDGYGKTIEVVELRYGRSGWVLISKDGNGYADTFAFTHHHAPTVEDVLREFVTEFNRDDTELCDGEIIERFAAKLQLKEDA